MWFHVCIYIYTYATQLQCFGHSSRRAGLSRCAGRPTGPGGWFPIPSHQITGDLLFHLFGDDYIVGTEKQLSIKWLVVDDFKNKRQQRRMASLPRDGENIPWDMVPVAGTVEKSYQAHRRVLPSYVCWCKDHMNTIVISYYIYHKP